MFQISKNLDIYHAIDWHYKNKNINNSIKVEPFHKNLLPRNLWKFHDFYKAFSNTHAYTYTCIRNIQIGLVASEVSVAKHRNLTADIDCKGPSFCLQIKQLTHNFTILLDLGPREEVL